MSDLLERTIKTQCGSNVTYHMSDLLDSNNKHFEYLFIVAYHMSDLLDQMSLELLAHLVTYHMSDLLVFSPKVRLASDVTYHMSDLLVAEITSQ